MWMIHVDESCDHIKIFCLFFSTNGSERNIEIDEFKKTYRNKKHKDASVVVMLTYRAYDWDDGISWSR